MKKQTLFIAVLVLFLPLVASGDDDDKFKVDPFQFGLGTLATWVRDAGEPGQKGDPKQHGLYLQKHTHTTDLAAAQAEIGDITPRPAGDLDVLAFDIPGRVGTTAPSTTFGVSNGYCAAGSPRFTVNSTGSGTCHLGCTHGAKTHDAVTGWWEIKFQEPFSSFPGCPGVTGTVTRIRIIFDDGTDLGPGNVILDNIRVNNRVVGKPKGDD